MNNINPIKERQAADAKLAQEVMAFAANAQFNEHGFIKDDQQRFDAILEAAKECPLFEGAHDDFTGAVANAWASGIAEYANKNGRYPDAGLLANAYRSCQRLMLETAPGKIRTGHMGAMFEAAGQPTSQGIGLPGSVGMENSTGVMRLALFAALILPVALGATTADAVTFVPCERDESDIYKVTQVAASNFGDYKIGQELDMQSAGVYAHFHRHSVFANAQQPDGVKKGPFVFTTRETETSLNKDIPIRASRVKLLINRMQCRSYDDGHGNLTYDMVDGQGVYWKATAGIDYATGKVTVNNLENWTSGAAVVAAKVTKDHLPGEAELAVTYELDVEIMPEIIPLVNQKMEKWTIKPAQYALAAEYTVQALFDAQREFGLDLSSQLFNGARNWLSHETDMKRLREMAFHCVYKYKMHVGYPNVKNMDAYLMHLKNQLNSASVEMVQRTKSSGIRGGFAGANVANFLKSLPSSVWTPAPGYQESPYVQFCGTLFGSIRIYEIPARVSQVFVDHKLDLGTDQVLFYGRGDNIGDAGLVSGDAVPAIPFVHPTTPQLINRTTLWGSAINLVHPDHGEDYFLLMDFDGNDGGDFFDPITNTLWRHNTLDMTKPNVWMGDTAHPSQGTSSNPTTTP